jgi:hypothetical protein
VSSLWFTEDRRGSKGVFNACVVIGFAGASIDLCALTTILTVFQLEINIPNSFPDSFFYFIFLSNKDVVLRIRAVALWGHIGSVSSSGHYEHTRPLAKTPSSIE